MFSSIKTIRVRYDEVDRMGYVYHGNYAKYYHISRTQLLRRLGICDKVLEDQDIIMPVIEIEIKYIKPIIYDEKIRIASYLEGINGLKLRFRHIVFNQQKEVISKGISTMVFVNSKSQKPIRIPDSIQLKLRS